MNTQTDSDQDALIIYTIYNSPLDFPGDYVISKWMIGPTAEPIKDIKYQFISKELESCRDEMRKKGLACLSRNPEDHPTVVESWI